MSITVENFGSVPGVVIAEFGKGTIRITAGEAQDKSHKGLYIGDNPEPREIGSPMDPTPTTDEFKPKIALVFHNEEAFSVFEEYVQGIRARYDRERLDNQS